MQTIILVSGDPNGQWLAGILLRLMERGCFGRMDQGVSSEVGKLTRAFSLSEGVVHGPEEVNLRADVLDPVLAELANEMDRRKAVFHNGLESIPNEKPMSEGDRFWLKVIFRNLLNSGQSMKRLIRRRRSYSSSTILKGAPHYCSCRFLTLISSSTLLARRYLM